MTMSILYIAKKEIMDNIRNKWFIVITGIFATIAIISSFIGTIGPSGQWMDFKNTITLLMFFVQFIVPIIGLMLGYASITGETERGTMSALLSYPVTRLEIIIGKFIGLGLIIALSIFIGFGFAGIIIGLNVQNLDYGLYMSYIFFTTLLGLVFLAISMFFSSVLKKRSTSMGMSIFTWSFFSFLWGMLMFGLMFLGNTQPKDAGALFTLNVFSPVQAFLSLVAINIGPSPIPMPSLGLTMFVDYFPEGIYNTGVLTLTMLIWIISMLGLAYLTFRIRDI